MLRVLSALLCFAPFFYLQGLAQNNILLSGNSIPENEDLYTFIGKLSVDGQFDEIYHYSLNNDSSFPDNQYFKIRNDSLFSYYGFDYEVDRDYSISISATDESNGHLNKTFEILIDDITGKFDENGIADVELAAKYPGVRVGDYLFFNSSGNKEIYKRSGLGVAIRFPNKILIKGGKYSLIELGLKDVTGNSDNEKVIISNFLGQVYTNRFRLLGGKFWRLTGQFNKEEGFGSKYFLGCETIESNVDYCYSAGKYGIWISREWAPVSTGSNLTVSDTASNFELDHIEISDGGFAGMLIKEDHGTKDMNGVHLHHLYIHDIGSEGIYLGSTQSDPQHQFNNLLIEHNYITRTGTEALQTGQLGDNCIIRNNVLWGAFDWASPFQRYQDNVAQVGTRQGGLIFENNILIGGGEKFLNISNSVKQGITPNNQPMVFQNNLFWSCRGGMGAYQAKTTDGVTQFEWKNNYWGQFIFEYDVVYPETSDLGQIILVSTNQVDVSVSKNHYDFTSDNIATLWGGSSANLTKSHNYREKVKAPSFVNLLGKGDNYNYLKWSHWTASIGEDQSFPSNCTNKGKPMIYLPGEVVQYKYNGRTRFYRCIKEHSGMEPGNNSDYWELLSWNNGTDISYYPPDDARLKEGSFYQLLGIGLEKGSGGSLDTIHNQELEVAVYPTVVYQELTIETPGASKYEIYTLDGRKLLSGDVFEGKSEVYLGHLAPGVYVINVWNDKARKPFRFIKQ